MPVTIKEIAALANVSRGTVDKVLNNRPGVKDTTREKVLKIAKQLNYQPNFIGKALVHSRDPIKLGIILTLYAIMSRRDFWIRSMWMKKQDIVTMESGSLKC